MRALAVLAACVVCLAPTAAAQETAPDSTPNTCDAHTATWHIKDARQIIRAAYRRSHWRHRNPAKPKQRFAIAEHLRCLERGKDRKAIKRYRVARKRSFGLYRAYRRVAPCRGFRGEGLHLTWLAVPRYIVECETNGYHGDGRWRARNPSGAQGPAQLLGWPAPYPAMSARERVRYWRVARQVWLSSGPGAWACA